MGCRRLWCVGLLLIIVPAGMAWRMAPWHLPPFAFKYGGSALWAAAVYWLLAALLLRRSPAQLAALAAGVAFLVECGKLIYWPPLDRFSETLTGKLLLRRYFSFGALAAYALAIAFVSFLDYRFRP